MENFDVDNLARLYELRAELDDTVGYEFRQLEDASDGPCADCARHDKRWVYGSLRLCRVCCRSRLAVRELLRRGLVPPPVSAVYSEQPAAVHPSPQCFPGAR